MRWLDDARMYLRFARELPGFLRGSLTLEEAEAALRRRLEEREARFLRLVERGIFEHPRSPYRPLFELAQCSLEDVRESVAAHGLETTLERLRAAGVSVGFEELKGRVPMVRDGREIPVEPRDFDNPHLRMHYAGTSGGSTGAGTRVGIDLQFLASRGVDGLLLEHVHGLRGLPSVHYYGGLPDHGLNSLLSRCRHGSIPRRWFSPVSSRQVDAPLSHRLANALVPRVARWRGVPLPSPEHLPPARAVEIARWMHRTLEEEGACVLRTHVSHAVRVCVAAKREGWRLDGAAITIGGEPPTPAKHRAIVETGARPIPGYHMSEIGAIAFGCVHPADENDLHLLTDRVALIQAPRAVPGFDVEVAAFLFTTLDPASPKLLLNFEGDDYGEVEERSCGCAWEAYGLVTHLRGIRSYRKLTGDGMTLVGGDLERLIDEVLPARFGGTPLDYQFVEEEDENGFTRVTVVVDPEVRLESEEAVVEAVLEAIGRIRGFHGMAATVWRQTGALRVRREAPRATSRGKLSALRSETGGRRVDGAGGGRRAAAG